jgi:hypothetical protein
MTDVDQYDDEYGGPPRPRPRWIWWLVFALLALLIALPLAGCGNISCDFLGSNRLRSECQDNTIIVPVYSVPTYIPGKSLKYLVARDRQNPFDLY